MQPISLGAYLGQPFFIDVDHNERLAALLERFANDGSHPPQSADDVMIVQFADRILHTPPFENGPHFHTDNPLAEMVRAVSEDAQTADQIDDDKQFGRRDAFNLDRLTIADRRQRDDGHVQAVDPIGWGIDHFEAHCPDQRQRQQQQHN